MSMLVMKMDYFIKDLKKFPITLLGYLFLSFGIMLTMRSGVGMSPWGVFHEGLSVLTQISFGVITQIIGVIVLVISVGLLKTKVGLGTIFNVILVGWFIDLADQWFTYLPSNIYAQYLLFFIGLVTLCFGRSLYIASRLGPGPRDGLFVGLSRILNIEVKYVKPAIELTVLFFGFLFGGTVGPGTLISALISGYLVQVFFKVFHYHPSIKEKSDIFQYFHVKSS